MEENEIYLWHVEVYDRETGEYIDSFLDLPIDEVAESSIWLDEYVEITIITW